VTAIFTSTTEWDLDLSRPAFTLRGQGHNAVRSQYGSHQTDGLPVMDHAVGKREFVGFQAPCQKLRPDEAACEIAARLTQIFLRDDQGNRPVLSQHPRLQTDAHFRDHVLFYEYFHGDTGRGVGASHQTGWTGVVAKLLQPHQRTRP
jgi:hypothetical protein